MSYLNDYLLESQIEDAYEEGFLDALEKVAQKEERNEALRGAGYTGAGLGAGLLGATGYAALHGKTGERGGHTAYSRTKAALESAKRRAGAKGVSLSEKSKIIKDKLLDERTGKAIKKAYGDVRNAGISGFHGTTIGKGTLGGLGAGLGAYGLKRGYEAMTEKKAAYEEAVLDKIAASAKDAKDAKDAGMTFGDRAKKAWEATKGYGKSAYEHVGNHKGKYGAGAATLAGLGGLYAYKKHQEKKAAYEAALNYLEDDSYYY